METLAKELKHKINDICIGYHYFRRAETMKKSMELSKEIERFVCPLLNGNRFGMEETEYKNFQNYVLEVLKDYAEAAAQRDSVYMVDTLDYGLRELINIFTDAEDGEEADANRDF